MKRLFINVFCLILSLSLSGCSSKAVEASAPDESVVQSEVVQAVSDSDAYQLGFDEGTKFRNIEVASEVLNEHFESYGMGFMPNLSIDEQIRACEETVTIDPELCADGIREQNSPEYKRKIYRQYAEDVWEPMGLLNFLENTEKNKQDFISGFMTGLFG
jgi:hypothetical protein